MGLNSRSRGRGRGNKVNFHARGQCGSGIIEQIQRPGPPAMFYNRVGFSSQAPFSAPPNSGKPLGFNFGPPRPALSKFTGKNFRKNVPQKNNNALLLEIDLTRPWVTEEIKSQEAKKLELLEIWRKNKTDEAWNTYKTQKLVVQSLYVEAKSEYNSSHPGEVNMWVNVSNAKNHYCETCDKSFRTDEDLFLHEAEHETCGRDGCKFTAHPKIIAKHIKIQHLSGLYKRIGKLYSEEDIAKWIEERKKHYPTRKVVEEKKILEEEKLRRGEKINNVESKFNKQFQKKNKSNAKKKFEKLNSKNRNRRMKKKRSTLVVQNCLEEDISTFRKGVPAFLGIKSGIEPEIPVKENFSISDEEWEAEYKVLGVVKPSLNNSLELLAKFYDSEEENQFEEFKKEDKITNISADEGSDPEEVKTVCCKDPFTKENLDRENCLFKKKFLGKKNNQKKKQITSNACSLVKRDSTLLEKLLKKEIKHERNVILQCVHYVVKNNFFKT